MGNGSDVTLSTKQLVKLKRVYDFFVLFSTHRKTLKEVLLTPLPLRSQIFVFFGFRQGVTLDE